MLFKCQNLNPQEQEIADLIKRDAIALEDQLEYLSHNFPSSVRCSSAVNGLVVKSNSPIVSGLIVKTTSLRIRPLELAVAGLGPKSYSWSELASLIDHLQAHHRLPTLIAIRQQLENRTIATFTLQMECMAFVKEFERLGGKWTGGEISLQHVNAAFSICTCVEYYNGHKIAGNYLHEPDYIAFIKVLTQMLQCFTATK